MFVIQEKINTRKTLIENTIDSVNDSYSNIEDIPYEYREDITNDFFKKTKNDILKTINKIKEMKNQKLLTILRWLVIIVVLFINIFLSLKINFGNFGMSACSSCGKRVYIKFRGNFIVELIVWILLIICAFLFHWLFVLAVLIYPIFRMSKYTCEKCGSKDVIL